MNFKNHDEERNILNFALKEIKKKNFNAAINYLEQILKKNPKNLLSNFYLGNLYMEKRNFEESIKYFTRSVKINKKFKEAFNNLGIVHMKMNKDIKAKEFFEKAILLDSNYVDPCNNLGILYRKKNDIKNSEKNFLKAYKIKKDYLPAIINLIQLYERLNDNKKLDQIITLAEDNLKNNLIIKLYRGIFFYKIEDFTKAIECLSSIRFSENEIIMEKIRCLNLGKSFDKLKKFELAFKNFEKVKKISQKFKNSGINKENFLKKILDRKIFIEKEKQHKFTKKLDEKKDPVFMIGFPRSGTTLLDTILSNHPDIFVIEERPLVENTISLLNIKTGNNLEKINFLKDGEILELRNFYFLEREKLNLKKNNSKIIIDKMPLNIIYAAEILRIFPNSKFILSLRNPLDVVISCFFQNFKLNDAMANFLTLNDTTNLYSKVMDLWVNYTSKLEINYHSVKYESLVTKNQETLENLIKFLEIDWNESLFNKDIYKNSERLISTPSYQQVNKPIYLESINRWKNYKNQLSADVKRLEPWVRVFDYA